MLPAHTVSVISKLVYTHYVFMITDGAFKSSLYRLLIIIIIIMKMLGACISLKNMLAV
jgi:hypothetical protein